MRSLQGLQKLQRDTSIFDTMKSAGLFQLYPIARRGILALIVCFAPLRVKSFLLPSSGPRRQHIYGDVHDWVCPGDADAVVSSAAAFPESHFHTKTATACTTRALAAVRIPKVLLGGRSFIPTSSLASYPLHRGGNINTKLPGNNGSSSRRLHGLSNNSISGQVILHTARRHENDSPLSRSALPEGHDRSEWKKTSKKGSGGGKGDGRGGGREKQGGKEGSPSGARTDGEGGSIPGFGSGMKAEFSRKIDCLELNWRAKFYTIEATHKECTSLAKRFGVERITGLKADLRLLRGAGKESRRINVKGRVTSDVCQLCASTLEPFDVTIHKEFSTVVQEVSLDSVESTLWSLENDTETEDEIMEGDPLDLGEIAAQAVALCIDPFAKRPKAAGGADEGGTGEGENDIIDMAAMNNFFLTDE